MRHSPATEHCCRPLPLNPCQREKEKAPAILAGAFFEAVPLGEGGLSVQPRCAREHKLRSILRLVAEVLVAGPCHERGEDADRDVAGDELRAAIAEHRMSAARMEGVNLAATVGAVVA